MARGLSLRIEGLEDLQETLRNYLPREARNILRNTVHGIAGRVRDELKKNVTKDTRALEKSIKAVRRRGKPDFPVSEVRGGATAPYMLMLEYGTSRTLAQPFIVPTVEQVRPKLAGIYREEFGKKLEQAAKKRAKRLAK